MSKQLYGGIDPGKTGGIVIINEQGEVVEKMVPPLISSSNLIDIKLFTEQLQKLSQCSHIAIEKVHSIYGASAKSNFQFGHINGYIEGVLTTLKVPFTFVTPKKWQKEMWQGVSPLNKNPKANSLLAARMLLPNETFLATQRSRKPHDGLVDAALLALYCKRKFKN